jgi:hypothetical protein
MRKFAFLILMLIATTVSAQQLDLKSLDKLAEKAKSKTEINMDESTLKSATSSLNQKKGDEAIAKKTIEGLKGFFLRAYEFGDKGAYKLEDLKPLFDQLKEPNWKPILRNKENGEQTEIWMHMRNGEPDGMVLISAESKEIVVINGIGVTRLDDLTALGNMDPLK